MIRISTSSQLFRIVTIEWQLTISINNWKGNKSWISLSVRWGEVRWGEVRWGILIKPLFKPIHTFPLLFPGAGIPYYHSPSYWDWENYHGSLLTAHCLLDWTNQCWCCLSLTATYVNGWLNWPDLTWQTGFSQHKLPHAWNVTFGLLLASETFPIN